jgi:hypothetical protein
MADLGVRRRETLSQHVTEAASPFLLLGSARMRARDVADTDADGGDQERRSIESGDVSVGFTIWLDFGQVERIGAWCDPKQLGRLLMCFVDVRLGKKSVNFSNLIQSFDVISS